MKRLFCDRCTMETTGNKRAMNKVIHVEPSTGVEQTFELCGHCAVDWWGWLREPVRMLERINA